MSAIKLERGNTIANPLPTADVTGSLDNGTNVGLGSYCAGTRLLLRNRHSNFYINDNTCPPGHVYDLEGPYLRIRPALIKDGVKTSSSNRNGAGDTYSNTGGAAIGPNLSLLNPTGDDLYYEIDANNASIFLPFDCSVDLYTCYAGLWIYDVYKFGPEWSQDVNNVVNANVKQTRIVRGISSRIIPVPVGAHSMQFVGDSSVTFIPGFSDAPKTVAGQADQMLGAAAGTGAWPGVPGIMANARVVTVSAASAEHDGAVVFGISIP